MKKKMGIEGVGPAIILYLAIALIIIYFISRISRGTFEYGIDKAVLVPIFWVFLVIGLIFWLGSAVQLIFAWRKGKLITNGFYAVFLNPLYVAWIIFLLPALSLYLNSWLYLLSSVVMYYAMRKYIKEEDDYLRSTFGKEYENYRKKVLFKI